MSDVHVFVRCLPEPEECLMPNERDYPNDKRINELKKILSNQIPYICIIGMTDDDISDLYRRMIHVSGDLDGKYISEKWLDSITDYKKIFWFKDVKSYQVFEDVYSSETNELIIEQYNRIFESIAGNNMCISLNDCRGMICRLPYDMSAVAKIGKIGMQDFL